MKNSLFLGLIVLFSASLHSSENNNGSLRAKMARYLPSKLTMDHGLAPVVVVSSILSTITASGYQDDRGYILPPAIVRFFPFVVSSAYAVAMATLRLRQ